MRSGVHGGAWPDLLAPGRRAALGERFGKPGLNAGLHFESIERKSPRKDGPEEVYRRSGDSIAGGGLTSRTFFAAGESLSMLLKKVTSCQI
jgi:hypothetical protein